MNVLRATRKQCVTIIELMVVIALISLAAGVLSINANRLLREERFHKEVFMVLDKLKLGLDLTLLFDVESKVQFIGQKDGIDLSMKIESLKKQKWILDQEKGLTLKAIHFIEFDDFSKLREEGRLSLHFLSNGSQVPRGILRLSTSRSDRDLGALTRYIALPGYPAPIKIFRSDEEAKKFVKEEDNPEDQKLTRYMMEEVSALYNSKAAQDGQK